MIAITVGRKLDSFLQRTLIQPQVAFSQGVTSQCTPTAWINEKVALGRASGAKSEPNQTCGCVCCGNALGNKGAYKYLSHYTKHMISFAFGHVFLFVCFKKDLSYHSFITLTEGIIMTITVPIINNFQAERFSK